MCGYHGAAGLVVTVMQSFVGLQVFISVNHVVHVRAQQARIKPAVSGTQEVTLRQEVQTRTLHLLVER